MKLDLWQIASVKARHRHRDNAGLGYLLARIRRELEERWEAAQVGDGPGEGRVLLLDFEGGDLGLGEGVVVRRVSLLDWVGGAEVDLGGLAGGGVEGDSRFRGNDSLGGNDSSGWDGVIMCLQPAWLEWRALLAEVLRVLRPGGCLLFCTFGPDTLQELRWAWHQADDLAHVHPFTDMHLLGDQLLQSGFTRPIVDADWVTVEYENDAALYADLRAEGFVNILRERRKTLTGKHRFERFRNALNGLREAGQPLAITYELIYGVATAPSSHSQLRVAPPKIRD